MIDGFAGTFTPVGEEPVDVFAPAAGNDESGFFHGPSPRMSLQL
jgi:hypothetical protein